VSKPIDELKINLKNKNIRGLALDIDETLSRTIGYWVENLQLKFGNPENLSVQEFAFKYQFMQNVPYWQTKEALNWMENARKSNKIQEILPLIENANEVVGQINKIIPICAYITIRSQSVIPGTKKWLKKHGFPDAPVIAKPNDLPYENGSKWKAEVLTKLYPQIIGIIDDNPSLIDFLPKDYKGYVFLYNNSEIYVKNRKVIPCKNWNDVLLKVKERKMI
jgi:hypothetical protein